MLDIINLALPFFGLTFVGLACGKLKRLPDTGLAWMNFFIVYVALPASEDARPAASFIPLTLRLHAGLVRGPAIAAHRDKGVPPCPNRCRACSCSTSPPCCRGRSPP
jgi:hypothetical protein